jgi:phytoene dehydrogenase-like protein
MFAFVFRMFADGAAVLPAAGMEALPRHLARGLAAGSLRLHARVAHVGQGGVTLDSGERLPARAVVLATDGPAAAALAGDALLSPPASRSVTCLYFDASRPPVREPVLVLNGEGKGPVQTLCVPSQVSAGYAPAGRSLVSVSVPGDPDMDDEALAVTVLEQLTGWFGAEVAGWRLLRIYRVLHAQPEQGPNGLAEPHRPVRLRRGLYVCGDHRDNASINGALVSGRRAAEALLEDLQG